jgi:hypothetical protein
VTRRLGRVCIAADLHVVVQERDELGPGIGPEPDDRRVLPALFLGELVERTVATTFQPSLAERRTLE